EDNTAMSRLDSAIGRPSRSPHCQTSQTRVVCVDVCALLITIAEIRKHLIDVGRNTLTACRAFALRDRRVAPWRLVAHLVSETTPPTVSNCPPTSWHISIAMIVSPLEGRIRELAGELLTARTDEERLKVISELRQALREHVEQTRALAALYSRIA